ncbi:MAG: polyhydroxyalkanoate synthesis regulator DNA-binding domain-containing protein [Persicimonas sp.]
MTTIIKRYPNRKLYDTERSSYVTLDQIEEMVKEGKDVKIVDNSTGEDITNVTLAHIIFEQERSQQRMLPVSALRGIIQSGEDFINRLQSPVTQFRDEFRRKAEAIEEGGKAVRDFVDSTQRSIDEMQRRIDDRLRDAVDQLTHIPEMKRDMHKLERRVIELEARLERMEKDVHATQTPRHVTTTDPHQNLP